MLYWMRASIANQLAHSGKSWAQIFALHHSGTYANQWMILDYSKFSAGAPPQNHFLTVLEEVPGYIHYEDMTSKLTVRVSFFEKISKSIWFNSPVFFAL